MQNLQTITATKITKLMKLLLKLAFLDAVISIRLDITTQISGDGKPCLETMPIYNTQ
jgi:hypothetical protein